jgi:hypothetical protein
MVKTTNQASYLHQRSNVLAPHIVTSLCLPQHVVAKARIEPKGPNHMTLAGELSHVETR